MISEQNILQTDLDEIKKILHRVSVIFFLHFKSPESHLARKSSRPKSYRPKPESRCPKYIVMSPEIPSHVARNFIECINLKKSNVLGPVYMEVGNPR